MQSELGTEFELDITESEGIFYCVHIPKYDLYFSSRIAKGMDVVHEKARIMVDSYLNYMKYHYQDDLKRLRDEGKI